MIKKRKKSSKEAFETTEFQKQKLKYEDVVKKQKVRETNTKYVFKVISNTVALILKLIKFFHDF